MRLGRLAAAGLIAGALVAFAIALLMPHRRPVPEPQPDTPDLGSPPGRPPRHVDLTGAEQASMTPARNEP